MTYSADKDRVVELADVPQSSIGAPLPHIVADESICLHRNHNRERFIARRRHFILAFHDSTFECVAPRYEVTRHEGPLDRVMEWMRAQLRR
jgi:hypothetical protein